MGSGVFDRNLAKRLSDYGLWQCPDSATESGWAGVGEIQSSALPAEGGYKGGEIRAHE